MIAAVVRKYHHGDLRDALLNRAEETIRDKGIEALSLRGLARDLCVSHGAPSRHFKDKKSLLDALAIRGFRRLDELWQEKINGASHRGKVYAMARVYINFATENQALMELMLTRKHSAGAEAKVMEAANAAFETPRSLITEGQSAGEVIDGDPDIIGLAALSAMQGFATFITSGLITPEQAAQLIDVVVDQMLDGVRPR
ncbi:MAG: TetR/AcrR family transcriptional regulator [Mycobacteriaceae bacterium]